jgi:hypothetical protein
MGILDTRHKYNASKEEPFHQFHICENCEKGSNIRSKDLYYLLVLFGECPACIRKHHLDSLRLLPDFIDDDMPVVQLLQ